MAWRVSSLTSQGPPGLEIHSCQLLPSIHPSLWSFCLFHGVGGGYDSYIQNQRLTWLLASPGLVITHDHTNPLCPKGSLIRGLMYQITHLPNYHSADGPVKTALTLYLGHPRTGPQCCHQQEWTSFCSNTSDSHTVGLDLSLQNHGGSKTNMAKGFPAENHF